MTFAISNLVSAIRSTPNPAAENKLLSGKRNKITLVVDILLFAGAATAAALILAGIFPVSLPIGVGVLTAGALLGGAGVIALSDITTVIVKLLKNNTALTKYDSIGKIDLKNIITNTTTVTVTNEEYQNYSNPFERIFNGLYLGHGDVYRHSIGEEGEVKSNDDYGKNMSSKLENAPKFNTIISVFHQTDFVDERNRMNMLEVTQADRDLYEGMDIQAIQTKKIETKTREVRPTIEEKMLKQNVKWHFVGQDVADRPNAWNQMVINCSETEVLPDQVEDYFKPIFEEIDKGILGQEKVFVHCSQGVSRSATILAAYLIHRFDVTAAEALNYLTSKRLIVDSKFKSQLEQYETDLKAVRNPNNS